MQHSTRLGISKTFTFLLFVVAILAGLTFSWKGLILVGILFMIRACLCYGRYFLGDEHIGDEGFATILAAILMFILAFTRLVVGWETIIHFHGSVL